MSAKDIFHQIVRSALEKEGWRITNDPLYLKFGDDQLRVDLGAERLIAAERDREKIAVEVKSFLSPSAISEFHTALGQFFFYFSVLQIQKPDRKLYLAVNDETYRGFFLRDLPQLSIQMYQLKLIIFEPKSEVILQWIN